MRLSWQGAAGIELDKISQRRPGEALTKADALRAIDSAEVALDIAPERREAFFALVVRELGLSQLLRSIGRGAELIRSNPSQGSVEEVAGKHGIPVSSLSLVDRMRGQPPASSQIEVQIQRAANALGILLQQAGIEGELPRVETAKLAEGPSASEALVRDRDSAWSLYQQAKASLKAGKLEIAEAQLELAAAYDLSYLTAAQAQSPGTAEVMRAQNRIGMVLHQFGLLAKARGDEASHHSNEVKALRWYADATGGENLENYQPAAFLNSACSYAQLGDLDRGLIALQQMLDACGSDEQRVQMKKIAREDPELAALYARNPAFDRLVAA